MDGDTIKQTQLSATDTTEDHQTAHPAAATASQPSSSPRKFQISSDYYREVTKTTDIAGRLPNAVYTLPPHIIQAIVGLADVKDATRKALVFECRKFYLASKQYERSKEVFVDGSDSRTTTVTLDCGRLYAEGNNGDGQCGIGSEEDEVTGPRPIRLPPMLEVWCDYERWFAKTTRGLYAWGKNESGYIVGILGFGDDEHVRQPRRVPIDSEVLDVCQTHDQSFFRSASGWLGCGWNKAGQLGLGHTNDVTTPTLIQGSEGVTRWAGRKDVTCAFTDDGLLACGINGHGQCGVGSTADKIPTLTPVALPDDVKGRVDRVCADGWTSFLIAGRRCFAVGLNRAGQLGIGSDENTICTPIELPIPVDDIISKVGVTIIRSGDTLLACGDNRLRQISSVETPRFTTPTPLDLPGSVVKVDNAGDNIFAHLTDGSLVGRGRYSRAVFVPEAGFIERHPLPGWTPVNARIAKVMNLRGPNVSSTMFLPEPITNGCSAIRPNNQESHAETYMPAAEAPGSPSSPAPGRCIAI